MNDIIKPHNFEKAKNELLQFSKQTNKTTVLSKVDESEGLFGWFDHTVKGDEFNRLVIELQKIVKDLKGNDLKIIDEFGTVYRALESLDSEYIPAILTAVKSAETASDQAKTVSDKIKELINQHEIVIQALKSHKERLEALEHLENIDELWDLQKKTEKEIKKLNKDRKEQQKTLKGFETQLNEYNDQYKDDKTKIDNEIEELTESLNELEDANKIMSESYNSAIEQLESINANIFSFDERNNSKFLKIKKLLVRLLIGTSITFGLALFTLIFIFFKS